MKTARSVRSESIRSGGHQISEIVTPGPESSLAVLSSVNICDEYFDLLDEIEELKNQNMQLHQDVQHHVQLWEEAKKPVSPSLLAYSLMISCFFSFVSIVSPPVLSSALASPPFGVTSS